MLLLWIMLGVTGSYSLELKLIHVIFSHKFYAPVQIDVNKTFSCPDKLDYRYFLENTDDMVNSEKLNMFNLGVYLRQKYNDFLGQLYYPGIMEMRTTEYILSMISAQLVNAGLWPPADTQKWNDDLDWQPIPTVYDPTTRDTLLLGSLCPSFLHEEERVYQEKSTESLITVHNPMYKRISKLSGMKIERPADIAMLYSCLETNADYNVTLPAWAKDNFPDGGMENVTLLSYDLLAQTTHQKQLNGGVLLKKIINNTLEYGKANGRSEQKIFLYSGEERNLIGVLQSLNQWSPHILSPASSLIFEIYYDNSTQYTVKTIFYAGADNDVIPIVLKNCEEYCPINKFTQLLMDVLPTDESKLCQFKSMNDNEDNSSSTLSSSLNLCLILMYSIVINYY